ncbi:MAG: hypothetical protein LBQ47_04055 [Endomicrobium sp.]|jgi:ferredoxin-thioredoxin reductase catalytic subunit/rubredoxin|nr:hypothetical protein [Endomicrobium sp.]
MSCEIKTVGQFLEFIKENARQKGYLLNNIDKERVDMLIDGLFTNLMRYGHASCPCRLSCGDYQKDEDIICPCVYMESDVEKYGSCFCGLYISQEVSNKIKPFTPVPENRPKNRTYAMLSKNSGGDLNEAFVWKCAVCGYEHKGANPPEKCPKCSAAKIMFKKIDSPKETVWKCGLCGHEHKGANPPDTCPKCGAQKEMFSQKT